VVRPSNANSGRRDYFRELMRRKVTVYTLVLGCVGGFVVGAWQSNVMVMVLVPATVVVSVLGVAAALADKRAARNFFQSYAEAAGLEYVGDWEIMPFTPLLGAGDRQRCENWMVGDVMKEPRLTGGLGHFIYEHLTEKADPDDHRGTKSKEVNRLTICVADLEESILLYKGMFLRQRRGILNFRRDWLANTPTRAVEVESSAFTRKYELRISDEQDEILMRRLLSPTLVNWLAGHPLSPGFELRGGTLVVFVPRGLDDSGNLTFVLDATREIARRVLGEVHEATERMLPKTRPDVPSSASPRPRRTETAGL
jgi:hypothetical protein